MYSTILYILYILLLHFRKLWFNRNFVWGPQGVCVQRVVIYGFPRFNVGFLGGFLPPLEPPPLGSPLNIPNNTCLSLLSNRHLRLRPLKIVKFMSSADFGFGPFLDFGRKKTGPVWVKPKRNWWFVDSFPFFQRGDIFRFHLRFSWV